MWPISPSGRVLLYQSIHWVPTVAAWSWLLSSCHRHGATDSHNTRTITRGSPQGFQPVSFCCMDLLGVLSYVVLYRLVRVSRLDKGSSGLHGCVLIVIGGFLELIIGSSLFGKNSVALGIRPDELAMDQR